MKMTIRKIAEIAGVSRGAVDKVIHNRPGVKDSVRKRVLEVIEETGYVPIHAQPRKTETEIKVAVIMPHLNNPYFKILKRGMDQANEAMPALKLEYYYCDSTDIKGILAVFDFLEDRNIDLYLIRGVNSERLKQRINSLKKPVIYIDSAIPGSNYLCLIGEDCYRGGRIAASLIAKTVLPDGEIAVIAGSPEVPGHKQRLEGFLEAIKEYGPHIRIVEQVYSQDQGVIAYERACQILQRRPKLCGICNLAGYADEIGQAILDQNRRGSVKMVCYNASENVAALIHQGIVSFSIGLSPLQQGQEILQTAYTYLIQGKEPHSSFLCTPFSIVIDETVDLMQESDEFD